MCRGRVCSLAQCVFPSRTLVHVQVFVPCPSLCGGSNFFQLFRRNASNTHPLENARCDRPPPFLRARMRLQLRKLRRGRRGKKARCAQYSCKEEHRRQLEKDTQRLKQTIVVGVREGNKRLRHLASRKTDKRFAIRDTRLLSSARSRSSRSPIHHHVLHTSRRCR